MMWQRIAFGLKCSNFAAVSLRKISINKFKLFKMDDSKVFMFPEGKSGGIDATTAMLLGNNGGFGNGFNNPLWMMFMYPFILPFINMFGGGMYGGFGNGFGGNNGTGFIANQLNNNAGRDLILQALNGRADAIGQLAQITNNNVDSVRDGLCAMNAKLSEVGSQIGMSGMQVINAVQSGNASIGAQLAQCCCENRLATCQQTNTLSSQAAANFASMQLEMAKNEAADQLSVCQQTNQLGSQADRNTNSILNAIASQNTLITKEFCDLKERELQDKINTQGDIITQLRGQISNDKQTEAFNAAFKALDDKIDAIAAKQPNTVPVVYPNVSAVNNTPSNSGCNCGNTMAALSMLLPFMYGQTNFFN